MQRNKSPWFGKDDAFDPMYDETIKVVVTTPNGKRQQSLKCSVFRDQFGSTINDDMVDSEVQHVVIICRDADWCFVKLMKIGNIIERASNGKKYSLTSVDDELTQGIVLKARSC